MHATSASPSSRPSAAGGAQHIRGAEAASNALEFVSAFEALHHPGSRGTSLAGAFQHTPCRGPPGSVSAPAVPDAPMLVRLFMGVC